MKKNAPLKRQVFVSHFKAKWPAKQTISLILLICLFLFSSVHLYAQAKGVTGIVKDENGQPIPGVSVNVQGRSIGTTTDTDGKFMIEANTGATVVFTHVSFGAKEIPGVQTARLSEQAIGNLIQVGE